MLNTKNNFKIHSKSETEKNAIKILSDWKSLITIYFYIRPYQEQIWIAEV